MAGSDSPACVVDELSSRACERGTKGFNVAHDSSTATPPRSEPGEVRVYLNPDGSAYASTDAGPVVWGVDVEKATNAAFEAVASAGRRWHDLTRDEQERVKRLLTPDPEDSLDDLLARMNQAQQILRGERP